MMTRYEVSGGVLRTFPEWMSKVREVWSCNEGLFQNRGPFKKYIFTEN